MSTIKTLSKFYYGHKITVLNRSLDFKESAGGTELKATLLVGDYTPTEFAAEVARALNVAGSQTYTVVFNRTTRKIQITAANPFWLLAASGSRVGTGVWPLLGFTVDVNNTTNAIAPLTSGKEYRCQYPLFKYTSIEHNGVKESASVQVSAVGVTQLISFGDGARVEMGIRLITNKTGLKNSPFYENTNGVSDALDFLKYITSKNKVEFMADVDAVNSFDKLILESTPESRNGTEFMLKNMKTTDVYETGDYVFRKVLT